MFFFSIEIVIIKKKFLIIKKEGAIESSCVEQVFFLVDENRSEFYCFKKLEVSTCKSQVKTKVPIFLSGEISVPLLTTSSISNFSLTYFLLNFEKPEPFY